MYILGFLIYFIHTNKGIHLSIITVADLDWSGFTLKNRFFPLPCFSSSKWIDIVVLTNFQYLNSIRLENLTFTTYIESEDRTILPLRTTVLYCHAWRYLNIFLKNFNIVSRPVLTSLAPVPLFCLFFVSTLQFANYSSLATTTLNWYRFTTASSPSVAMTSTLLLRIPERINVLKSA